jgi:hypothetical protein
MKAAQTPSFALTTAGLVLASLSFAGHDWATKPAIILLAVPGIGGMAIAIYEHVEAAGEAWAWRAIVRAFVRHRPRKTFWVGILGHLPQALLALLLLCWPKQRERRQ